MENKLNLYQKIAALMGEIKRVEKTGKNKEQNYDYATDTDVSDMIRPLLAKHGIVLHVTLAAGSGAVTMRMAEGKYGANPITGVDMEFTLINADNPGERLTSRICGEGMDRGDKGLYKAYTGAAKYFMLKSFGMSTGNDPERDDATASTPHKTTLKTPTAEGDPVANLKSIADNPDVPANVKKKIAAWLKINHEEHANKTFLAKMLLELDTKPEEEFL